MIKKERNPKIVDFETLNTFLMGSLNMVRRKEISVEETLAISKLADTIVKNNMTAIAHEKLMAEHPNANKIVFFNPNKQLD